MKLLALSIDNFRGIQHAAITFGDHDVIVGPNGSGKSTIVDALSLVFGRTRLVRDLTEHDFHGSNPEVSSRIKIIATMGGFTGADPNRYPGWFRQDRAVPKWWNPKAEKAEPEQTSGDWELCAQIAFAARFDQEELIVEQMRYFHDDDSVRDVFLDDTAQQIPHRFFDNIGYYVLPARRTWEAAASFASELFRKVVATVGGIPARTILAERERLRQPQSPLEMDEGLVPLVERVNAQLTQLIPCSPQFQLRLTATDSDSLIRALVPHYQSKDGVSLPVGRHGTGLLSLQTFILLLELGKERRRHGKPFMLAIEEPELHIPPGLQRRLVAQAVSVAGQTICTSHSPRVAAFYPATSVKILEPQVTGLTCKPLLDCPLAHDASNAARKLYHDDRPRVIEALMHDHVLVPEGRSEYEWFRLVTDVLETGDRPLISATYDAPPFGAVIGVIPTHDSAVSETFCKLRSVRDGLVPLVDGDAEGNKKIKELSKKNPHPEIILQWADGWEIEDAIGWILKADEDNAVKSLRNRIDRKFTSIDELMDLFKTETGATRLKTDYLAYQEVAAVIGKLDRCTDRAEQLLGAMTRACLRCWDSTRLIQRDESKSGECCVVLRISP